MKIPKYQSSEVFDAYMKASLKKKAGISTKGIPLKDLIPATVKVAPTPSVVDDVTEEIVKDIPDDITEQIVRDSPKVSVPGEAAETAAKVAPEVGQAAIKMPTEITFGLAAVKTELTSLSAALRAAEAVDIANPDELSKAMIGIERARSALASQVSSLSAVAKTTKDLSLEAQAKLNVAIKLAAESDARAVSKLQQLNGFKAAAGSGAGSAVKPAATVAEAIADEAAYLNREIDLYKATIEMLTRKNIAVTPVIQQKLSNALEKSAVAAGHRRKYKFIVDAEESNTGAGKLAKEVSETTTKEATAAIADAKKAVPAGSDTIDKAVKEAATRGTNEVEKALPEIPPKKGWMSWFADTTFGKKIQGALGAAAATAGLGIVGTGLFAAWQVIKWTMIFAVGAPLAAGAVGVAGVSAYMLWRYWVRDNPEEANALIGKTVNSMGTSTSLLKSLKFKSGSNGEVTTNALVSKLEESQSIMPRLLDVNSSDDSLAELVAVLTEVERLSDSYIRSSEELALDLVDSTNWNKSLESLGFTMETLSAVKEKAYEAVNNNPGSDPIRETEDMSRVPVARTSSGDVSTEPALESNPQNPAKEVTPSSTMINVLGQEIDIGHLPAGFRSAAPRMRDILILSKEGLAFLDPENVWGGWFAKTGNLSNDYLRAMKYLYSRQVTSVRSLKKFIRDNLPKVSRKRLSGWKNAVKYYKNKDSKYSRAYKFIDYNENILKTTNIFTSNVMNKTADNISKNYFEDAIKDLSDQYAKSYYTGLKSMYEEKPKSVESDYKALYQLHNETGADLIGAAHPKSIVVSDAMGNGGLIENTLEQNRYNQEVALSMPSGNYRQRHAQIIERLVKLANEADLEGKNTVSDLIDSALNELVS